MSTPKYKRSMTGLKCNACGHEFEGLARHEAVGSLERGMVKWVVDSGDAFRGVRCPKCGSELIGSQGS